MKIRKLGGMMAATVVALAASSAWAGPDWIEQDDAGPTFGTAQRIVGVGELNSIQGTLTDNFLGGDFEDVYLLRIEQPTAFSFDFSASQFDCVAWLFNVTRANEMFGLLANDNASPEVVWSRIAGPATDNTSARVTEPGVYALAITGAGRVPTSRTGSIFNIQSPTEVSGPDGMGGLNPHQGWSGDGQTGGYLIMTTGTGFFDVPAPGVAGVVLGGLAMAGRRRRK